MAKTPVNPLDAMDWERRFMAAFFALLKAESELEATRRELGDARLELVNERLTSGMQARAVSQKTLRLQREIAEGLAMKDMRAKGVSDVEIARETGMAVWKVSRRIHQAEVFHG